MQMNSHNEVVIIISSIYCYYLKNGVNYPLSWNRSRATIYTGRVL